MSKCGIGFHGGGKALQYMRLTRAITPNEYIYAFAEIQIRLGKARKVA